ncbi:GTP-binding protein [Streptomyces sp. DSM 42041]|uniref:GTP-binding protein n=1 Tax=Streptomyces hazeniae TaxID=3075538 RepID=A0ABU2NZ83_9ACTN|nr:GTP-binding protein [Streptomyces sp. DSM 42041]MDT0382291.1 GTP-binding protein [Streptomyces sp. DSM 42041]
MTGNSPQIRGEVVDRLQQTAPGVVVLSVSLESTGSGHPVVQRLSTFTAPRTSAPGSRGATGDPTIVLRQDLLALRRDADARHVALTLPGDVDLRPFLAELWRPRLGCDSLGDHYDAAPVLVGIDPDAFLSDLGRPREVRRLWHGRDRGEAVTCAEAAARQVEAADCLILPSAPHGRGSDRSERVAALVGHLNPDAHLIGGVPHDALPATASAPRPPDMPIWDEPETVSVPRARRGSRDGVDGVLWRARRPLHPGRLSEALPTVMAGVLRSRGHLWLAGRPDSVITWRSAGSHLELREADDWLDSGDATAWRTASPSRRTLASWFWHDYYGERRNEVTFTGVGLDADRLRGALDAALLTDAELVGGRDAWAAIPDPLLSASGAGPQEQA